MSTFSRILAAVIVIGIVLAAVGVWFIRGPGPMDVAGGSTVAPSDYHQANPTGVPASLAQASLVERGAYLAKAADCMVCHTAAADKEYAGGLGFKLPFGTLYSTNITPDKETGIGNYSDQDFLNSLHRGVRRDGARLYPAMPYTSYTYISDDDALAIKAYLFSLPPVHAPARENTLGFPFNQRWGMMFWSAVFNPDTRFKPNTSKSVEWNRGAYLAEALAHCGECHTPRNPAFALDNRNKFAGALTAGWRAFNISSDKQTGIGAWSDDQLASYLSTGYATGHGTASGPMGEAVDHSLGQLAPEDIRAIVAYLRSVPAVSSRDLPATTAPPAPALHKEGVTTADARGKMVFEGACVSCHGWTGESPVSQFATFTGSRAVNDPGATNVVQIVISGTKRLTPAGAISMPAFGDAYSDDEIAAVANYVTKRFGAEGSRITADEVAALRKQADEFGSQDSVTEAARAADGTEAQ
jgi:mono/diheme cytochrome c family protein